MYAAMLGLLSITAFISNLVFDSPPPMAVGLIVLLVAAAGLLAVVVGLVGHPHVRHGWVATIATLTGFVLFFSFVVVMAQGNN